MNKNTINWTDNKVINSNSQQRPSQTSNEQYYMDPMPTRPMHNMTTYNDNMQNVQNSQGTQGAQTTQPPKNAQTMPSNVQSQTMPSQVQGQAMPAQMPNQVMPSQVQSQTMPYQETAPMTQRARNDYYVPPIAFEQGPPPVMDKYYIAGYLTTLIGKNVRAEFAISTGLYLDKAGVLREVGVNYFVLEDYITRARIMCDLYSVKFVTTL